MVRMIDVVKAHSGFAMSRLASDFNCYRYFKAMPFIHRQVFAVVETCFPSSQSLWVFVVVFR